LSKHTIERLSEDAFKVLTSILASSSNWIDVTAGPPPAGDRFTPPTLLTVADTEVPPSPLPDAELRLLERDLQRLLSRNLARIEKGLVAHPDYQLEEFPCDVGRLDFLCKDAEDNWVVIELKADWIDDSAVGQILGYMSWVKDNLPNGSRVRGIIVGKRTSGRVKAAVKLFPGLSIKRFTLDCQIDEMS
jgi:RecB family endonuclease NucS